MENETAVRQLSALAQHARLAVFRHLVVAGPDGLCPSDLLTDLSLTPSVLSFHLKELRDAGLLHVRQDGRRLYYSADYSAMNTLMAYLSENCCGGVPQSGCTAPPNCEPSTPCATS